MHGNGLCLLSIQNASGRSARPPYSMGGAHSIRRRLFLFHGHALGQVAGLIHVTATQHTQGDSLEDIRVSYAPVIKMEETA